MCPLIYHHNGLFRTTMAMYITLTVLLLDLNMLCVMDHLRPLTLCPYIVCWVHWYQQYVTVGQVPKCMIATRPVWWYWEITLFSWLHHVLLIVNFKLRLITHNAVLFFIILNWPNRINSDRLWCSWSLQILIKWFFIVST